MSLPRSSRAHVGQLHMLHCPGYLITLAQTPFHAVSSFETGIRDSG